MKQPSIPPSSEIDFSEEAPKIFPLLEMEEVRKFIQQANEKYLYWDELKYKKMPEGATPEQMWKLVKQNRNFSRYNIKLGPALKFDFNFTITRSISELLHKFDLNLGGILEGSTTIPGDERERYLISSLMEEAIASSQLEGAATTRKVAKEMLRQDRRPRNHSEKMILNNYLTVKEIKKYTKEKLTPELIKNIHSVITKGTLGSSEQEGAFRTTNDVNVVDGVTGEIFYTPPEFHLIDELIETLCDFANSKNDQVFIHPIIKAIILHFMIGYIHPFVDGNGRTARAIFYWYLISKGYWLLEFLSISKSILEAPTQYARAYLHTEHDENDLTYFFNYNLKVLDRSFKTLDEYLKRKLQEKRKLYDLQNIKNINERQVDIIIKILKEKHKFYSIKEIQSIFGVVYQTARTDLLGLEKMGLVQQKKLGKKLLFYKSEKFEDILKKVI